MNRNATILENTPKQSNSFKFIKLVQHFKAKQIVCNKNGYSVSVNGYTHPIKYRKVLYQNLNGFETEIQHLPFLLECMESRKEFTSTIRKYLNESLRKLNQYQEDEILKRYYPYRYIGDESQIKYFPKFYCETRYQNIKDYENHKVHYMFKEQYEVLTKAKLKLNFLNKIDKVILNIDEVQEMTPTYQKKSSERFITSLSVAQMSLLFGSLFDNIAGVKMTKKEIAEFIANNFGSVKRKEPSSTQIYKDFYDSEDSTIRVVREIFHVLLSDLGRKQLRD